MLVLSRGTGDEIFITTPQGDRIIVKVVESNRGHMRLGITAPKHIKIFRGEIQEIIDKQSE